MLWNVCSRSNDCPEPGCGVFAKADPSQVHRCIVLDCKSSTDASIQFDIVSNIKKVILSECCIRLNSDTLADFSTKKSVEENSGPVKMFKHAHAADIDD